MLYQLENRRKRKRIVPECSVWTVLDSSQIQQISFAAVMREQCAEGVWDKEETLSRLYELSDWVEVRPSICSFEMSFPSGPFFVYLQCENRQVRLKLDVTRFLLTVGSST